jgi:flagellar assembly protein FliH
MSDAVIPKEKLTAWQRWELPAFDGSMGQRVSAGALPTAGQLEQIHQQARDEGYQAGYAEGSRKAAEEAQRMAGLLDALTSELQQVDQTIAQDLLNLALEVAKQMLHQTLEAKPEMLLNVIRDAISSLPHFNQAAHLVLHPADAELVRSGMGEQLAHSGWKIFEDSQMQRGGCRVETAHSQIDATSATRWKHIVASIGQDNAWMEP